MREQEEVLPIDQHHVDNGILSELLPSSIATVSPAKPRPGMNARFDAVFWMKHFSRPCLD